MLDYKYPIHIHTLAIHTHTRMIRVHWPSHSKKLCLTRSRPSTPIHTTPATGRIAGHVCAGVCADVCGCMCVFACALGEWENTLHSEISIYTHPHTISPVHHSKWWNNYIFDISSHPRAHALTHADRAISAATQHNISIKYGTFDNGWPNFKMI